MTELQTFATLVAKMRQAQRDFFRGQKGPMKSRLLIEAKNLEVEVDKRVKQITESLPPGQ